MEKEADSQGAEQKPHHKEYRALRASAIGYQLNQRHAGIQGKPVEYCRDEGLRKYWDEYSYPFHKEGDGPLYRGKPALEYNHNMDQFAIEMVRRWYD